jgi:murein DD-endopeptidase MepM/ murein hydrolase activator NlpD
MIKTYFFVLLLLFACNSNKRTNSEGNKKESKPIADVSTIMDSLIVDGFDYPTGNIDGKGKYKSLTDGKIYDSWRISTKFNEKYDLGIHPGIDINGTGGGNTDRGQPVYSIAKGIVVDAKDYGAPWGCVVVIRHNYIENGHFYTCFSLSANLEKLIVKKGDVVKKRKQLGSIGTGGGAYSAHLHLEIRKENMKDFNSEYWPSSNSKDVKWVKEHYIDPVDFIKSHRKLTCPYLEDKIIIAIKNKYRLYYYKKGILKNEYEIALSQSPIGHKQKQGDNKMPEGEYYICEKQAGPFYGDFAEFLGNRTIRISYPNISDANAGFKKGLISKQQKENIISANLKMKIPLKNTKLGGSIVIHGWNGEWVADGKQNLTWGCINMHNADLEAFYDIVELKTKIIITK